MTPLRQRMIDDMTLHGFSRKTVTAYVACVARFARYFAKSPEVLGTAEIRSYLLYLTHDRRVSASTYNQALCALKFLYRVTPRRDWGLDGLARSRHQLKLPVVLSVDEVTRFFEGDHQPPPSGHPHDRLCRRPEDLRSPGPARRRHRQPTHGHPRPAGQGVQRSLRHALAPAAHLAPGILESSSASQDLQARSLALPGKRPRPADHG